MYYIQRKGDGYLETVDQFETYKEADLMLSEYGLSDPSADYYISNRACDNWKQAGFSTVSYLLLAAIPAVIIFAGLLPFLSIIPPI